jgi:mitochondrial chaperone BCS1
MCSHHYLLHCIDWCWQLAGEHLKTYQYFTVPQYNPNCQENALYRKVATYITSLPTLEDSDSASFFSGSPRSNSTNEFKLHLGPGETVHDFFKGTHITWTKPSDGHDRFVLRIGRQDRVCVFRPYLLHVQYEADKIELNHHELHLFTHTSNKNGESGWIPMPFTHPATFDTLVIDPIIKRKVRLDLESFMKSCSYYYRLGRVWNRSYLLYGQSGTGKSSFAIAMARALCFDVCIIDMSHCGIDIVETLIINTRRRSMILLENLDLYFNNNLVSGTASMKSITSRLISCCGDERIMVFTMTGDEDLVDRMVLPVGRFDMSVYLPMCDFNAFKKLAEKYLGVREHNLFPMLEGGFQRGLQISPARVGEIMLANRKSASQAIQIVLDAMESTKVSRVGSNSHESRNWPKFVGKFGDDKKTIVREDGRDVGLLRKRRLQILKRFAS